MLNMRVLRNLTTAVLFGSSLQAAVVVSPTVTPAGINSVYDYELFNTEPLEMIGLDLLFPTEPQAIAAPLGWISSRTTVSSSYLVQWFAAAAGVAPGTSLSGFAVELASDPGAVPFNAIDAALNVIQGVTTTAPIPEPGTNMLVGAAFAFLLAGAFPKHRFRTVRM
jgi:hypothetical protein